VAIHGERLTRIYQGGAGQVIALNDVSLEVPAGSLVVVQGPSGCGKSTLLNMLGLLDRPTAGEVKVSDQPAANANEQARALLRRRYIGYLFQDAGLIDRMSVAMNVSLPLAYRRIPLDRQAAMISEVLSKVRLAERSSSSINELSGGQRQRIGLARALIGDPTILVCDEPTASLDEENGILIADLLAERAASGAAVVCSSHDSKLIERANTIVSMEYGKIVSIRQNYLQ
jgi:putative ABC transport system ATP-binding protein